MTSLDYMYLQDMLKGYHNGGFYTDVKVVTRNRDGSLHNVATWRVRADGLI
ncbi:hypothetical protein [Pseudoalteromonas sp. S16_S37]|uniref:hypothetical protein n=1 Tax=Pseudoalteromonas sp. S16_S37 TaxID=2720228 RepID=UPI001681358F|nr:hypothetical protein [Pseudoalteromonas sp. S16_S37]MBD1583579.1 hypothetical protein [Pseudoalteromonas sp. S16_S37]